MTVAIIWALGMFLSYCSFLASVIYYLASKMTGERETSLRHTSPHYPIRGFLFWAGGAYEVEEGCQKTGVGRQVKAGENPTTSINVYRHINSFKPLTK